ncbi:MAG: response regulator [Verrucomicrobia bacterium]|nr:response regulator [Verrucomicrobiota bacterium]
MKSDIPQPEFLSVPEAAKICGVTRNTLYTWVRKGTLHAYQTPGRTNLIRPSDLVKFMEQNGMFVPGDLVRMAQEDEKKQSMPAAQSVNPAKPSVLVVDDDPSARSLAVRALRDMANVYQAETGYEALHLLTKEAAIRLVLIDLRMPGQHGLATIEEIRQIKKDVKIVVVTAFANDIPSELTQTGAVVAVIEKPYQVPDLVGAIGNLLG